MATDLAVYKLRRIVPVRFDRAKTGDPDAKVPQPDDRGYAFPERGPIFGVLQGDTVKIRLRREEIATDAPLFVKSSDERVFTVEDPSPSRLLPDSVNVDIKIKGVAGGTPSKADLEVHFALKKSSPLEGPKLHSARIWVWHPPLDLRVTCHLVTIKRAARPSPRPSVGTTADVGRICEMAAAIWRPCGVRLLPNSGTSFRKAAVKHTIELTKQGVVKLELTAGGEVDQVLALGNVPHTVNAYFIHRFDSEGTLGLGISPDTQSSLGLGNNGILLADVTVVGGTTFNHDIPWSSNDLAHEIGHFLTLPHVENRHSDNPRMDTWSRRCLMHPTNTQSGVRLPFQLDVGYGSGDFGAGAEGRRGALITMKDLTQLTTDGECTKARGGVSKI